MPETICLAFTGASGMAYGVRLLECLLGAGCRVQLLYSQVAQIVARQEMAIDLPARASDARRALDERFRGLPGRLEVYGREEWFAPLASGSNPPEAMVICPCSMGTLAAVAQGLASKLIERAADVVLKEGRKLIVVPVRAKPRCRRFISRTCCACRGREPSSCRRIRASTISHSESRIWSISSWPASSINCGCRTH